MGNTNFSLSYPEIWSKYLAKNLDAESVAVPLVSRSVESDIKNFGDTVNVQKYGNVTANSYTAGSDTSVEAVALTNAQLILDQAKYFRFVIDRLEEAQTMQDLVKGFTKRGMIALSQAMDDRIFTHYADASASNVIGSTTIPRTITKDNVWGYFIDMGQKLDEANVPSEGRVAIIDPGTKALLVRSPEFMRDTQMGDTTVTKGTVGQVNDFKVVVSNRITTVTGSKPLMFFHPEFISLAVRINPNNVETYKPEAQFGTGVKTLIFYGSKVFNASMGGVLHKAV